MSILSAELHSCGHSVWFTEFSPVPKRVSGIQYMLNNVCVCVHERAACAKAQWKVHIQTAVQTGLGYDG